MANTYLSQTISSSTGKKFTLSMWVKRAKVGSSHMLFHLSSDSGNTDYLDFAIKNDDKLDVQLRNGSSTTYYRKRLNRLFRDVNAWYHLVWRFDSTNSTADDRWIMYVNGERATDIDLDSTPSQVSSDYVTPLNRNGATLQIGNNIGGSMYLEGCLSHVHFCDGYSYGADSFGSTDSTTGEWKINTSPSVSYGTNGFLILKDGNTITDQSSNSNNFSLGGGTLTKTEDCPSNVFATFNPLNSVGTGANPTYSLGNTKAISSADNYFGGSSSLGITKGKYYIEVELDALSSGGGVIGMSTNIFEEARQNRHFGQLTSNPSVGYYGGNGNKVVDGGTSASYGNSYTSGDIIGIAINCDNNYIYFAKNGTWQNSGDPTSGATGTGGIALTSTDREWFLSLGDGGSTATATYLCNFGNGYFGTTAVSSAGTNASGNGIFEYDVPTGYTALSTKGLNL